MVEIPAQLAKEPVARDRGHRTPRLYLGQRIWARLAAPALDGRIAAGEDPSGDILLTRRAAQLVSDRRRRGLVQGLERVLSPPPSRPFFSSAVAPNWRAVDVARPALERLAQAMRSRDGVQARGVVLTHRLLTDPCSALYHPAQADELYEVAREAMLALPPDAAAPRSWESTGRSHGPAGRRHSAQRSRSPL